MNLNFDFSKSMNLNLNLVFSQSMNLNLNLIFSKSMNLNLNLKIKEKMNGSNPGLHHHHLTLPLRFVELGMQVTG